MCVYLCSHDAVATIESWSIHVHWTSLPFGHATFTTWGRKESEGVKLRTTSGMWGDKNSDSETSLTCELSQDLFDGHTAGVCVSMGTIGGNEMIRAVNGCLNACSTCFLLQKTNRFLFCFFILHMYCYFNWKIISTMELHSHVVNAVAISRMLLTGSKPNAFVPVHHKGDRSLWWSSVCRADQLWAPFASQSA